MSSQKPQVTPSHHPDYREVDDLLQEQADKLSPEAKAIVAQALKRAKQRTANSAPQSRPS